MSFDNKKSAWIALQAERNNQVTSAYHNSPKKTSVFETDKHLSGNPLAAPARAAEDYPQDYYVPKVGDLSYLDHIANLESGGSFCGRYAITGNCSDSGCHAKIGRILRCGREWCPTCGQNRSETHRRRYGRLMPKAQQMRSIGIITITWPTVERSRLRTKTGLQVVTRAAKKVLKEHGYKRGISRWHWFGDPVCACGASGKKLAEHYDKRTNTAGIMCEKCGYIEYARLKNTYHPHLQLVFDANRLKKEKLESIKNELRKMTSAGVIHYSYADKPGKILHRLRYITRSTYRSKSWDRELAEELKGFRVISYWGTATAKTKGYWNEPAAWTIDNLDKTDRKDLKNIEEIENIVQGKCPVCGGKITWEKEIFDTRTRPQAHYTIYGESYFVLLEHRRKSLLKKL